MAHESHGRLGIDVCTRCSGVWFDGGELEAFLEARRPERPLPGSGEASRPIAGAALACPRCTGQPLSGLGFRGAKVHSCPGCRGIFLDGGSLRSIVSEKPGLLGYSAGDAMVDLAMLAPDVPESVFEAILEFLADLISSA